MAIKVVQSSKELEIREVLAYLERMYGMPAGHIRSIAAVGAIGEPMVITAVVYVQEEPEPDPLADVTTVGGGGGGEDIQTCVGIEREQEEQWTAPKIS